MNKNHIIEQIKDQIKEITHPNMARHIARPFDRLVVKDTDGKTVDVWEVMSGKQGA